MTTSAWETRDVAALRESEGVNVPTRYGWTFRVRRLCEWNVEYQRALARLANRPAARAVALKIVNSPDAKLTEKERLIDRETTVRAVVEGVLVGWDGVTDRTGAPLDFNTENAVSVLMHFPDIHIAVTTAAIDSRNFEGAPADKIEAVRGNSAAA